MKLLAESVDGDYLEHYADGDVFDYSGGNGNGKGDFYGRNGEGIGIGDGDGDGYGWASLTSYKRLKP